ncbi:hypothetical protein ACT29H_01700 [Thermophagus sp. OGC60D27]|uniref:hypothetical protein n=1 Tax=Thermophagus sp. OGC60D27 TaxID=3458415 RepID=UPI00403760E5
MRESIVNILKRSWSVIRKRWNEYVPFLAALVAWALSGPVLRMIDPTAGVDDAGLFQALLFGLVIYYAATAFSWVALRIIFPEIGRFVDNYLGQLFSVHTNNTFRLWYSLALFAVYFLGAVIIFTSVL